MSTENKTPVTKTDMDQIRLWVRGFLVIGFVFLVFKISYLTIRPFLDPIVWGIIISVGVYPLHQRFSRLLGNRTRHAAVVITVIGLSVLVVPTIFFTRAAVENISDTVDAIENGQLNAPPPDSSVMEWPIIGDKVYELWSSAAISLNATIAKYEPQIREMTPKLTRAASSAVKGILIFIAALIIAGVLLLYAKPGKEASDTLFTVLFGPRGPEMTHLSIATIRNVVQGVLGIAVIQAVFLGAGMFAIKLPGAGIFTILVLILAIVQLPTILVMLPVGIYVFSVNDTAPAIIFVVWTILWSISDNFLKPIFLGKGVEVPMLVILMGAIGGMILGGLVGLFVGAVILAWAYKMITSLMTRVKKETEMEANK
ncbi:MAG: AI-2E family transporter [Bacteroides sp.]|nr:AI-2E family transporter [Bacteroides sp.]